MLKILPPNLDEVLRIIDNNAPVGMKMNEINILIESVYITPKHGGGWMLTSKGRRYLREHKTPGN